MSRRAGSDPTTWDFPAARSSADWRDLLCSDGANRSALESGYGVCKSLGVGKSAISATGTDHGQAHKIQASDAS